MESTDSSTGSQKPQLPPGFRFHPTDEELVVHYLKKKAASAPLPVSIIAEVDLYKFDPWELPAKSIFGEQEWYFFSPRDRKYPNGARPNRAATSGYWKATGTDKPVMTAGGTQKVGVKKALVFYGGKPPKGIKTNWIMHEYRLTDNKPPNMKPPGCDVTNKKASLRLDDWVLCRIYKKNNAQRPVDQERDEGHDVIMGSFKAGLPAAMAVVGEQQRFLENDHSSFYDGMMSGGDHHLKLQHHQFPLLVSSAAADPNSILAGKRALPGLYWNDDGGGGGGSASSPPTKRFLTESCDGSIVSQLPQTPATLQQHQAMLGSLGDGVFRQQQYQISGMNWYA
ncbi:hypothetical protein ABFS82_13G079000 [Erythranthe guttata]|uniref:NAC domain-containing protein n=1 Tax=Erythranthe guttata TaxID=4155 RepID=A0A022R3L8_ERYGU|nr:PREDICTED: NAC transcription factor 25 [Erythranthe guttata]EYU33415.1 hypothetical protein MIMGU_mgv1a009589mg [Erythranthe guttata]|eukprot:XP_012842207.1 PREDICTED: NAC transcription factor 25 [Erythranthe guttata]